MKGEFEQRLKNIIDAVQQSPLPVLLFIDEAHTIIGAGNQAGGADAANLLKPALARGELRTIAATTWSEYKQYFERDAALERRFQMVKVDEPDDDTACLMLRGLKSRYAEHHGVHITDEAVKAAVTLSRRYLTGRQLPDKAVDLLDTASARVRMSLDTIPEPLTRMKAQLTALAMEKQALLEDIAVGNTAHGERLAAIGEEEVAIILQLDERETRYGQELALTQELLACRTDVSRQGEIADLQMQLTAVQQNTPLLGLDVDARTVATVIADWTGVPLGFYGDDDFLLDGNTPLGDEAMDAGSQLLVALTTDNEQEAQGWKPDGLLYQDFLVMLRVWLGWRFKAKITLTTRTRLLAVPPLGEGPFWLGMNGVLGADEGELKDDIPPTFTTELGYYTGLKPAIPQQGNRRVTYKFD